MASPGMKSVSCMYYLAVLCPENINTEIQVYKRWMKEHCGAVAAMKSPAHITIIPPFWWPEDNEPALKESVAQFDSEQGRIHVRLNGFSHFSNRVLFVKVEQDTRLAALHQEACIYFSNKLGKAYKAGKDIFHPHVTIATRDIKPGGFAQAWDYFSHKQFAAEFTAETLTLLKLTQHKWTSIAEKKWTRLV